MKKTSLFLFMCLALLILSCSKEEDEGNVVVNSSVTKLEVLRQASWNLESLSQTVVIDDSVVGNQTIQTNSEWTFLVNNTVISSFMGDPVDTTVYLFRDSVITIDDLDYDILNFTDKNLFLKGMEVNIRPSDSARMEFITDIVLDR